MLDTIEDDDWWFLSFNNIDMERVNLNAFLNFGAELEAVQQRLQINRDESDSFFDQFWTGLIVLKLRGRRFLDETKDFHFPNARPVLVDLLSISHKYLEQRSVMDKDKCAPHDQDFLRRFTIKLKAFQTLFRSESGRINAFVAKKKGILDMFDLIDNAEQQFDQSVLKHLPELAVKDLKEAGRCFAFNCFTAMGFHIVRCVEAVTLKYLETVLNGSWTGDPGLGQYIGKLKSQALNVPPRIIQRLDEIRAYERNGIAHPDFIVEEFDALPLFTLAQGIIPMMTTEIDKLETAKASGASWHYA